MSLRLNNSKDITCDKLWLLDANNNLQDVLTLINNAGSSGSGGVVQSVSAPLVLTGSALSLDQTGLMLTTHEANKIGSADVIHGAFDFETRTITLKNAAGVVAILSVDNGGNLILGTNGIATVPMLQQYIPTSHAANLFASGTSTQPTTATAPFWNGLELAYRQNVLHGLNLAPPLFFGNSGTANHPIIEVGNFATLGFTDGANITRNMIPSVNGSITYAGHQLVNSNDLATITI